MDTNYLILGIVALVVIVIAILYNNRVKASVSKKGFKIETEKEKEVSTKKDNLKIKNVSKSDVNLKDRENRNTDIDNIDDSNITIS